MWLMKVKESQQLQFFASYAIDIHANEFQPTNKAPFITNQTVNCRKLPSIYVFSDFPFGFEGRMWDLIVSVTDHCLFFYFLFVSQGEGLSFFSFVRGTNLFSVSKFICSPKKESEKLKNSHFGQIHVQFVLFTVSY